MKKFLERVMHNEQLIATIIRTKYHSTGIEFFTPDNFSQQLAYMNRPEGYIIPSHVHNKVHRDVYYTLEVLFIKSGRIRVDFYTAEREYVESRILEEGDIMMLTAGGHGFEMLEPSEIVEVKQGPYAGDQDKTRFPGISSEQATIIEVKDESCSGQ